MVNSSDDSCLFLSSIESTLNYSETVNTYVVSVITSILAVSATLSNVLALYVFYKIARLRTLSNVLLMSLCITDVLTGIIVQPFFVIRRLHELNPQNDICTIRLIYVFFASLCAGASILTVGLVTIDRFVAITMPYRYLSFASAKLYITVTALIWMAWIIFVSLPFINALTTSQYNYGISTIYLIVIMTVIVSYLRIYRIVIEQRRKIAVASEVSERMTVKEVSSNVDVLRNEGLKETSFFECTNQAKVTNSFPVKCAEEKIRSDTEIFGNNNGGNKQQSMKIEKISSLEDTKSGGLYCKTRESGASSRKNSSRKSSSLVVVEDMSVSYRGRKKMAQRWRRFKSEQRQANTIAIIIVTLMLCYLPQITLLTIRATYGDSRELLNIDAWADLFVFLNSSLNPLIYCLRNKEIRSALKSLFKRESTD